jgi:indolepyruvate decarboxylase
VINPDNCVIEMERVIAEARRNNQPAYIVVPSDYALAPVTPADVRPLTLKSNETSLQKAVAAITERLKSAKSVVALPAFTISRLGLQKEARAAIEAIGCPFATTSMEKSIIDESHPNLPGCIRARCPERDAKGKTTRYRWRQSQRQPHLDPARFISIGLNDVRVEINCSGMFASLRSCRAANSNGRAAGSEHRRAIRQ